MTSKKKDPESIQPLIDGMTKLLKGAEMQVPDGLPKNLPIPSNPSDDNTSKDQETDPEAFNLSLLLPKGQPTVTIKKVSGGTRTYMAVVKEDKAPAYVDFTLEIGLIKDKQDNPIQVVLLVARFIGMSAVGKMAVREPIPDSEYSRLSKFGWPICQVGPGAYFHAQWAKHKVGETIAKHLLDSWTTQKLTPMVTLDQLKGLIENVTDEIPSEDSEVFSVKPLGSAE